MCWNKFLDFFYPNPKQRPQTNHEFYVWAFGANYPILKPLDRLNAWNRLHGNLVTFICCEDTFEYLKIMNDHYKRYLLVNEFSTKIIEGQ